MKFPQVLSTMMLRVVVFAIALVVILPSEVFAQKVLLLAAEPAGTAEALRVKLEQSGRFTQVDLIDVQQLYDENFNPLPSPAPSLETLLAYDVILTWSNAQYGEPTALGNVLADYVDAGHGVVQAALSFYNLDTTLNICGRWGTQSYDAFTQGGLLGLEGLTLVPVSPLHPILDGVLELTGGMNFGHSELTVLNGEIVARWSNGEPLVSARVGPQGGRIVGLNVYPLSLDDVGTHLLENALLFAATPAEAPSNQPPSANAGPDQTLEAIGPAGAPFILTAAVHDPDGDGLTISWSGAATGTGPILTGTLMLPPPVNALSRATGQSYTFTLTVSDGKGGVTTDDVVVTVTDTTAPVLANVPASVVTATATSASGAPVTYGPITAADAVDGDRPVTCSKSGTFPIGDTKVTCSATDTRGNSAEEAFTVRVLDVTTRGMMWGDGTIRVGSLRYDIDFVVGELNSSQGAVLQVRVKDDRRRKNDHRFSARKTTFVAFSNDPDVRPGATRVDTVLFSGFGDWDGRSGYRFDVSAVDKGEHGRSRMRVELTITAPNGAVVARVEGPLSRGGCTLGSVFGR